MSDGMDQRGTARLGALVRESGEARRESPFRLRAAHDAGEQPLMPVRLEG